MNLSRGDYYARSSSLTSSMLERHGTQQDPDMFYILVYKKAEVQNNSR